MLFRSSAHHDSAFGLFNRKCQPILCLPQLEVTPGVIRDTDGDGQLFGGQELRLCAEQFQGDLGLLLGMGKREPQTKAGDTEEPTCHAHKMDFILGPCKAGLVTEVEN